MKSDLDIVVVTFNNELDIRICIESLFQSTNEIRIKVWVVDNMSTDNTRKVVARLIKANANIALINSDRNIGLAAAFNLVLSKATCKYIATINPDTIAVPGWATRIIDFLDGEPNCYGASPCVTLLGDREKLNSAGLNISVSGIAWNNKLGRQKKVLPRHPFYIAGIHGAAAVFKREVFDIIGKWPEECFLYYEDVEISILIRSLGFDLACVPSAEVCHCYRLVTEPNKLFLLERNRLSVLVVYFSILYLVLLFPVIFLTEVLIMIHSGLKGKPFFLAKIASYAWLYRNSERIIEKRILTRSRLKERTAKLFFFLNWGLPVGQVLKITVGSQESRRKGKASIPRGSR